MLNFEVWVSRQSAIFLPLPSLPYKVCTDASALLQSATSMIPITIGLSNDQSKLPLRNHLYGDVNNSMDQLKLETKHSAPSHFSLSLQKNLGDHEVISVDNKIEQSKPKATCPASARSMHYATQSDREELAGIDRNAASSQLIGSPVGSSHEADLSVPRSNAIQAKEQSSSTIADSEVSIGSDSGWVDASGSSLGSSDPTAYDGPSFNSSGFAIPAEYRKRKLPQVQSNPQLVSQNFEKLGPNLSTSEKSSWITHDILEGTWRNLKAPVMNDKEARKAMLSAEIPEDLRQEMLHERIRNRVKSMRQSYQRNEDRNEKDKIGWWEMECYPAW